MKKSTEQKFPSDLKIGDEIEYQINVNYKHINEFKTFIVNKDSLKYIDEEEWDFHRMTRLNK